MSGVIAALMSGGSGFAPVTRTYTTGTAATETVPAGASLCTITDDGAGGAGARDGVNLDPGGGGGGSRAVKVIGVVGGNVFTYTVAPAAAGRATNGVGSVGGTSTVTGTVLGGAVSMSAGGGDGGGILGAAGNGGTATGGDTNTAGTTAGLPNGGAGAGGGAGGTAGASGSIIGGGGGGVTAGTSGGGARGQITFYYT